MLDLNNDAIFALGIQFPDVTGKRSKPDDDFGSLLQRGPTPMRTSIGQFVEP